MWLPYPLYELLPYFNLVLSALIIVNFSNSAVFFASILLIVAILQIVLRKQYRAIRR